MLNSFLPLLVIVLAALLVGSAVTVQFFPTRPRPSLALAFAAVVTGVAVVGWLALVLAELHYFSALGVFGLAAVVSTVLGFAARRRLAAPSAGDLPEEAQSRPSRWGEAIFLGIWFLAALWLFFRPHQYVMGGADAGVYVSLGAHVAESGGFIFEDPVLAALDPDLQAVFLRALDNPVAPSYLFPGFYVTDAAQGAVVPQFYPLYPLWQAAAFDLAPDPTAGAYAALLTTGLWMLLASLAVYLTARDLGGWPVAALALTALSLSALQVWFARYSTTEALTQFFIWSGLWAMIMWQSGRRPAALWAFVSGLALGMVFLVRIDILVLLPVLGLFLVWRWARGWESADWWFAVPVAGLVIHSLVHAAWQSAPYFYEHIGYGLRLLWVNWWLPLTAALAGVVALWALRRARGRASRLTRYRQPALAVLIAAVVIFAVYGWFLRPELFEVRLRSDAYSGGQLPVLNHENWLRFGWYASALGVWLGVLGSCFLLWRAGRKTAFFLGVGLLFSALYLWNVQANPHHIYVMRRYVPVVVPFFIVTAAVLLGALLRWAWRRQDPRLRYGLAAAVALLAAAWLLGYGWSARGFISQVDHPQMLAQLEAMNDELPPGAVLLFNDQAPVSLGDIWGTPLRFLYEHPVFSLRDLEALDSGHLAETIEFWQNSGRAVVWIGDPAWLQEAGFAYSPSTFTITSARLESSYEHKPRAVIPVEWLLPLATINAP